MPSGAGGTGGGASEYVPIVTAVTKIGVFGARPIPAKGHRIERCAYRSSRRGSHTCLWNLWKTWPASLPARRTLAAGRVYDAGRG